MCWAHGPEYYSRNQSFSSIQDQIFFNGLISGSSHVRDLNIEPFEVVMKGLPGPLLNVGQSGHWRSVSHGRLKLPGKKLSIYSQVQTILGAYFWEPELGAPAEWGGKEPTTNETRDHLYVESHVIWGRLSFSSKVSLGWWLMLTEGGDFRMTREEGERTTMA